MLHKILLLCLLMGPAEIFAGDSLPAAFPLARYQAMMDRPPFTLAAEGPALAAATINPGFAKNLFLTGAVRLNHGEYVTIGSREQNQAFALQTGSSYNGISLVSVTWSDVVGKTRATLKCGNEFATITFDEATMRAPVKPSADATPPQAANANSLLPPGIVPPNPQKSGKPAPPRRGGRLSPPS